MNLSNELPPGFFAASSSLIEVVDRKRRTAPARERFKFYRDRGYAIDSRDISEAMMDRRRHVSARRDARSMLRHRSFVALMAAASAQTAANSTMFRR